MPVLVTGGAGYIGSHAVWSLRDQGYEVVVIDNLSTGFKTLLPADVPLFVGDIGDGKLISEIMDAHKPQAVLHFAGSVVVPESVSNPGKYYSNNTAQTLQLIIKSIENGVKRFIFSSTAAIYGGSAETFVSEKTQPAPINPYSRSKRMVEQMLEDFGRAEGFQHCALRYFNVAGSDPMGRTGQSTHGATHIIKVAVEAALGKRDLVEIFGTDYPTRDGTGVRDYIHVSDLVDAHLVVLRKMLSGEKVEPVMNCGYGTGHSVREVLAMVEKISGNSIRTIERGRRPGDTGEIVADNALLMSTTDWQPQRADLETIIRHALKWEESLG